MSLAGKIVFCVVAALVVLVVLSFVAPVSSEKPFWVTVQRLRNGLDRVCYRLFNGIAIAMGLLAVGAILYQLVVR